ncbi:MAG: hypothetical protein ACT4P3_05880 [Betaproteobacteria bacterium]
MRSASISAALSGSRTKLRCGVTPMPASQALVQAFSQPSMA